MIGPGGSLLTKWATGWLVALPFLQGLNLLLVRDTTSRKALSDLFQAVAALVVALVTIRAARALRSERSESAGGWGIIAGASCFWAAGMVSFMFVEVVLARPPYPGFPDFFFLLFYPVMVFGLWRLPRDPLTQREFWNNLLDVGALAVVAGLVIWQFNLRLLLESLAKEPNAGTWVSLVYTLVDTMLLLMLFWRLVLNLGRGRQFVPMLLLVVGCFFLIAADLLQGYVTTYASFTSGSPIDLGWVLFSSLNGLAALSLLRREGDSSVNPTDTARLNLFRTASIIAITYLWIAMVLLLLIWALFHRNEVHLGLLMAGVAAATLLAITRQIRMLRENARLYEELQQAHAELETKVQERTTALQQQTELLQQSERKFRGIVETTREWIWAVNLKGEHTYCNPAVEEILGYSPAEFLRLGLDRLHPEDRSTLAAEFPGKILRKEGWSQWVLRWQHRDGQYRFLESNAIAVLDEQGELVGFQGADRDITKRRLAEAALQESEAFRKRIFDGSRVPIVVLDPETLRYVDCNPAAVAIYCCSSREETLGKTPLDVSAPLQYDGTPSLDWVRIHLAKAKAAGTTIFEWRHQRPDGGIWDAEVHLMSFQSGQRELLQFTLQDITERKQAERERQQLQAQLVQAQKMEAIGTLAGGIAHDFNNILGAIICYAELAREDAAGNASVQDSVENILLASDRAKNLVRQILAFSRKGEQNRAPMLLQPVVKEAVKFLRSTLPTTIELVTTIPDPLPPILGNPTQIHQVLMNLGSNAAHALRQQTGRLEVRLELFPVDAAFAQTHPKLHPGEYLRLSVSDTGQGMDEAVLKRMFEPFFTTKGPGEGTGLGLSVVHGIVQDHDGAIDVYSQPGQGTVFHLYFPALEEPEVMAQPGKLEVPVGQGERILYVDDEPALCRIADRILKRLNYQPTTCSDARQALELFLAQPDAYDVVIADLTMPHLTGVDLAAAILEKRPAARILLATGFSGTWTRESVRSLGIRDLVLKPFNLALLGRAVHGAIHGN